jgi:hypothetical protein
MRHVLFSVTLIVVVESSLYGTPLGQRQHLETWYERAARQINPANTDYGAIWEQYKQAMAGRLGDPYFRYGAGATLAVLALLATSLAQHLSHRRAMEIAALSIADIRCHDQYARRAAREAIQRYNDHIEKCNRVMEADESGLWKWISSAELASLKRDFQSLNDEMKASRDEIKRLNAELEAKAVTIVDLSLRSKATAGDGEPSKKGPVPAAHIQRINQLELELNLEKKKNQRLKGTALDARNG